jgi:CheY-like chemotaxis protein
VSQLPVVGVCSRCGLRFGGEPADRDAIEHLRGLHERHCAGGDRSTETWLPFRAVYESRARRVLVVDDDPEIRAALRALLESRGHQVSDVPDAPAALALVSKETPDVALIDIALPGVDGYELARRLRALTRHAVPRLIAFTGYGRREDRARASAAGFDEFVVKPGDPQEIEALVAGAPRRGARG